MKALTYQSVRKDEGGVVITIYVATICKRNERKGPSPGGGVQY
mgnify:CR=1 FL=1